MSSIGTYWKSIVAVAGTAAIIIQSALTDSDIADNEWVKIGIAALVAIGVYGIPNKPYVNPDGPGGLL